MNEANKCGFRMARSQLAKPGSLIGQSRKRLARWAFSILSGRTRMSVPLEHPGLALDTPPKVPPREGTRPATNCRPGPLTRRCGFTSSCLVGVLVAAAAGLPCTAAANEALTVTVTRRDLRPLPGVTLQLGGAVNPPAVTDENGRAAFLGLAGAITITPSRSGFRFEPPQLTIPDLANPSPPAFISFPTTTDLAISIASDDAAPLVGGLVNGVVTLRNLGAEAATDVTVGFSLLPGLALIGARASENLFTLGKKLVTTSFGLVIFLAAAVYDTVAAVVVVLRVLSRKIIIESGSFVPLLILLAVAVLILSRLISNYHRPGATE